MTKDTKYIRDIKDGKIESFSYIVHMYVEAISRFVLSRVYNKDDAEDIIQDSFIKLYRAMGKFDESFPILPYLYQIARNEMKMYYRAHKQTISLDENIASSKDDLVDYSDEDPGDLITILSGDKKRAILLFSQGYSYQEIANTMRRPINTIRTLIRRARLQLIQSKSYEKS